MKIHKRYQACLITLTMTGNQLLSLSTSFQLTTGTTTIPNTMSQKKGEPLLLKPWGKLCPNWLSGLASHLHTQNKYPDSAVFLFVFFCSGMYICISSDSQQHSDSKVR